MKAQRIISFITILLLAPFNLFAQNSISIESESPYSVGFKTLLLADSSRQFKFRQQSQTVNRPIRLFIWYPASMTKKTDYVSFSDYVYSSSLTQKGNQLSNAEKSEMQNRLVETLNYFFVRDEEVLYLMNAKTKAIPNAPDIKKKFPLIVLGNVGEGFYYTNLAEFLASNGFVVVGLPSVGANEGESCGYDLNCLKLQQDDMEFAIKKLKTFPNVNYSKMGLIAWSFSGLTAAHLQLKNQAVKAVVSLDAATGYQYGKQILNQSKVLEMNKPNVPFLHFHGLGGGSVVPKNFEYFNAYRSPEKFLVAFKNLQHSDFIPLYGLGVRLAKREKDLRTIEAIRWVNLITLDFLNAHLKNDRKSLKFLQDSLRNDNKETSEIFSFSSSYSN